MQIIILGTFSFLMVTRYFYLASDITISNIVYIEYYIIKEAISLKYFFLKS